MKITKSRLKQIIKEELEQELDEIFGFGKKKKKPEDIIKDISKEKKELEDFRKKMMGTLDSDEPEETESSKKAKKSHEKAKAKLAALKKAHKASKETKK